MSELSEWCATISWRRSRASLSSLCRCSIIDSRRSSSPIVGICCCCWLLCDVAISCDAEAPIESIGYLRSTFDGCSCWCWCWWWWWCSWLLSVDESRCVGWSSLDCVAVCRSWSSAFGKLRTIDTLSSTLFVCWSSTSARGKAVRAAPSLANSTESDDTKCDFEPCSSSCWRSCSARSSSSWARFARDSTLVDTIWSLDGWLVTPAAAAFVDSSSFWFVEPIDALVVEFA